MSKRVVTFDNGNSHPHLGIYQDGKRIDLIDMNTFLARFPYHEYKEWIFIISHVGKEHELLAEIKSLPHTRYVKQFVHDRKLGKMPIHYSETLGDDRLVQAAYLFHEMKEPTILIDAGTFITIDLITNNGFEGGHIFPGMQTFLKAYQQGTYLPCLSVDQIQFESKMPQTTEEAILRASGLYLDAILNYYLKQFSDHHFVVTGGSHNMVKERLVVLKTKKLSVNQTLIHESLFALHQHFGVKK